MLNSNPSNNNIAIVYTTVESDNIAKALSKTLVQKKLCACVNIFPITSVYEWEGSINESSECAMLIKTSNLQKHALIDFLNQNHPYTIPVILEIPVGYANNVFQNWVLQQVG